MKNLKDVLANALGTVGIVVWYLASSVLMFLPLTFLNFPIWVDLIILFAVLSLSSLGDLIELALWIWSFIVVISEPIDGWSVFYFVALAVNVLITILPWAIYIISVIIEDIKNRK